MQHIFIGDKLFVSMTNLFICIPGVFWFNFTAAQKRKRWWSSGTCNIKYNISQRVYELINQILWKEEYHNWKRILRSGRNLHMPRELSCRAMCSIGPWFNIDMSSYQYRKSHCGDKAVVRSTDLHNGVSYTSKMASLYWTTPWITWPLRRQTSQEWNHAFPVGLLQINT